jgi:hypothetical protein
MGTYMDYCPLVRLANNIKLLKTFERTGQVAVPLSEWLWFFEALAYISHGSGPREIFCVIAGECLLFSKTSFK